MKLYVGILSPYDTEAEIKELFADLAKLLV